MSKDSKGRSFQSPAEPKADLGLQRVKSVYTVREISQLFGLSQRTIRQWTRAGLIRSTEADPEAEPLYDFRALTEFRRIREMRSSGMTSAQIDAQFEGQMNLFEARQGQLVQMPSRLGPFEEALLLHEKGDPRAERYYRKAIQDGQYVADAYCNLGILEYDAGDFLKAIDCLTLSLKNDPRHFESHFNLANLYFDAGDLRLARLHYEIATQIERCFAHLHFNLALVHMRQGDLDGAIASLTLCKEIAPEEEQSQVAELLSKLEDLRKHTPSG